MATVTGDLDPVRVVAAANASGRVSQRWADRRVRWVRPDRDLFYPERYQVAPVAEARARSFVLRHHYSGSMPAALSTWGLFDRAHPELDEDGATTDALVGVAVLSVPVSERSLTNTFPGLEPYRESCELGRLVLLDSVAYNAESAFTASVFRQAADQGMRGIVSFCDPMERRTASGDVVMPGHIGVTYRALGGALCGRSSARSLAMLPDGTVLNARALQKVRSGERGHDYVERLLVSFGAPARQAHEDPTQWLPAALDAAGVRRVRHPGNLRYLFRLGTTRRERASVTLGMASEPYPAREELWLPAA